MLPEMPLDILYEIFSHCEPRELLQLSRTTKAVRATLLSREAAGVWRSSLFAVGLGPQYMMEEVSEPQLAHILYDRFCFYCLCKNATTVVWMALARCCKKCLSKHFPDNKDVLSRYDLSKHESGRLTDIIPHLTVTKVPEAMWPDDEVIYYSLEHLKRYDEEYETVYSDEKALEAWWEEKEQCLDRWIEDREWVKEWFEIEIAVREDFRTTMRIERQVTIVRKLISLGWAPEIQHMGLEMLLAHRQLRKSEYFSEFDWPKIQDEMISLMKVQRKQRLAKKKEAAMAKRYDKVRKVYDSFLQSHCVTFKAVPRFEDIAGRDEIRDLIHERPLSTPLHSADIRQALIDSHPARHQEWLGECDTALVNLMRDALGPAASRTDLRLATTYFSARLYSGDPRNLLSYPQVLDTHRVTRQVASYGTSPRLDPWSSRYLTFDKKIYERARELVALVGKDPDTATADEMDVMDPWFERKAGVEDEERRAMRWREALYSTRNRVSHLVLLDEEDTAVAREALLRSEWKPDLSECRFAKCKHCNKVWCRQPSGNLHIYMHLKAQHEIEAPTPADFALDAYGPQPYGVVVLRRIPADAAQPTGDA